VRRTTGEGRLVAVALMLTGIALVGVVTAALASWFVEKVAEVQAAEQRTEVGLSDLASEVRALQTLREERPTPQLTPVPVALATPADGSG
jgi:voltage-gated potassium channel